MHIYKNKEESEYIETEKENKETIFNIKKLLIFSS